MRPYLKKIHHKKRAGGVAQDAGPEFKPQYCKKRCYIFVHCVQMYFNLPTLWGKETAFIKCPR
jgi:hypothetical protein